MNDTYLIAIGRRIRSIRISAHLSQEELAEKLSISQKHISRCENGASCLSLANLIEFCNLFDCNMDYLIFGNSKDVLLSKLPDEILDILSHGSNEELDRFTRYLQMYVELTKRQG